MDRFTALVGMFTRRDNECPRVPCVPGCTVGMCAGPDTGKAEPPGLGAGGGRRDISLAATQIPFLYSRPALSLSLPPSVLTFLNVV